MHPGFWKLIPLLMKEELLAATKKNSDAEQGDELTNIERV